MKIFGIIYHWRLEYFLLIFSFDFFLIAAIYYSFIKINLAVKPQQFVEIFKSLIKESWPLLLAGFAQIVYLKIDIVMLGNLSTTEQVGLYSTAAKISEIWIFLPITIMAGIFPKLIEKKSKSESDYNQYLKKIARAFLLMSLSLSVVLFFLSEMIIGLLFGDGFLASSEILKIHIWSSIFIFLGAILSKWIIIERYTKFSFFQHISGATLNVVLNLILIPRYHGIGAAVSTLVSYSFSYYFCTLFTGKTRRFFYLPFYSFK